MILLRQKIFSLPPRELTRKEEEHPFAVMLQYKLGKLTAGGQAFCVFGNHPKCLGILRFFANRILRANALVLNGIDAEAGTDRLFGRAAEIIEQYNNVGILHGKGKLSLQLLTALRHYADRTASAAIGI